ncbi:hypothetical protein TNIN_181314 [Trichonephila inaurata madagascariensis]|uniref:Uncharacterized protein n=1 Tax=Trichonephila inaurata madagascariensis TaxID=2747483 RepID=A0A8X6Y0Y2_9ARAC|nr:hypothetical protein TNIN_181314 [Trichonephila inaurata madagascariensis]
MVKVQECHVFRTCMDCLGANDPYCGWCSLENKCSLRGACAEAAQDPLYWLSYKSGRCTTITEVHPPQIQRTTARILNLVIDNLPALEGQFSCAFSALGKSLVMNATRSANGVNCATPHTDSLPPIPPGEHHFTAKLSVRMKTGPDFVATNFTFYDCSTYTSCTQCVSSDFPCDWCVTGHRCTHDTGENCRNDVLVTGVASVGPSIRSGPGFCPRINKTANGSTEILVASGISKRISVKVDNIQQHIARMRFLCQFNIEGRVKQVNAQLIGEVMYCEEMVFSYSTQAPNITAAFAVIWDVNKPFDNPENIHVLIFRCSGMAQSCGICLELPEKYKCGWCQDTDNSCQVYEHCNRLPTLWLDRKQTCPNPQILSFYPKSGPWEGGTNITIKGINLGRVFQDIANNVRVIHEDRKVIAECVPHEELYVKTTQIVCHVEKPPNLTTGLMGGPMVGYIEVKVLNDYTARSREQYSFVNPRITSIKPSKGPKSGGTILEIWGLHMDAGSRAEAFVGALPCNVTSRDSNRAVCITSASKETKTETVRIKFDNGLRVFEDYKFLYVEDPSITYVESGSAGQRGIPKGIPSGGISISVRGTNLNAVQHPYMYAIVDNEEYNSSCVVESPTEMKCKSPRVPAEKLDFSSDDQDAHPLELEYGFKMDHVAQVQNLSSQPRHSKFMMYPDPIYYPFSEKNGIKYYKSDYLTINGMNLDRASQETDVVVRIGTSYCNVTSLSRSQLTCRPPTTQPPARDANGKPDVNKIPEVVVEVGDHLKFTIGKLSYELPSSQDATLTKPVIIGVITGACILVVIVIIILIAYRRKSTESSRVLKNMQEQMDVLELRVASECKEAFLMQMFDLLYYLLSQTVYVSMSPQTVYVQGLEPHGENIETAVKVLDCDTISQVKEKALDAIYRNTQFSQRPSKDGLDLEWRAGNSGRLTLSDEDSTTKPEGEWKRLNTLAHYGVPDGALLTLVPKQSSMYNLTIMTDKLEKSHKYATFETLNFSLKTSPPLSRATSPMNHDPEGGYKYWHLVRHHDAEQKEGERGNKMVSEIYLTRLLATKGTLQKFVDDLFETIFSTAHRGSALPLAIKYMFDFLDDQALNHGITDPEVVHTWKSNSLPLRFWVNLIKNPNFVFDIHKSNIVDSCLSVVAQTFMDACSTSDHRLGKDSPSSKLLYAKDIPVYKDWVERYYRDIKNMAAISDQDMNAMLAEESRLHAHEFNTNVALYDLYAYAVKYNDQLIQTLEEDEFSTKNKLPWKLAQVLSIMCGESDA